MPFQEFDTAEAVPETMRDVYEEKDGKWRAKLPDVTKLEKTLETVRQERKDALAGQKLSDQRAAALETEKAARAAGVSEEELKKIRDAEALARKPLEEKAAALEAENTKLKLYDRVQAMYLDPKLGNGMADRVEDAMDQLKKRTKLGDAGGIVYLDKDGNVTADDALAFFTKFKVDKPWLTLGANASGSGAEESVAGGGSGYDAVGAGKAAAKEQKRTAAENALAFK